MLKVYRNSALLSILIIIGVQWGFYKEYTSEFPNFVNKTATIHIHGALLMTWMLLLIIQPLLISKGKYELHRSIGKVSYILGPLIILTMFLVGRAAYHRYAALVPEEAMLGTMVLDIRGYITFGIFWTLAMLYRKDSTTHMRYMIATGMIGIGPGVGRGLINSFGMSEGTALTITDGITLALVALLIGFDFYKKKNYKPFLTVFMVFLIGSVLWQVRNSEGWQAFARWYAAWFY